MRKMAVKNVTFIGHCPESGSRKETTSNLSILSEQMVDFEKRLVLKSQKFLPAKSVSRL